MVQIKSTFFLFYTRLLTHCPSSLNGSNIPRLTRFPIHVLAVGDLRGEGLYESLFGLDKFLAIALEVGRNFGEEFLRLALRVGDGVGLDPLNNLKVLLLAGAFLGREGIDA